MGTTNPAVGTSGSMQQNGFRLTGGEQTTLQQFVNQRVEIRGTFQDTTTGATATRPAPDTTPMSQNMRTLRITSIRPVAGECAGKDK